MPTCYAPYPIKLGITLCVIPIIAVVISVDNFKEKFTQALFHNLPTLNKQP